jgi:hypothetical protein
VVSSVPVYLTLQIWFGYAWSGRWRIAALIPLPVLVLSMIIALVSSSDLYEQNPLAGPIGVVILTAVVFSPFGSIYLTIAAVVRRLVGRRASAAP